MKDINDPAVFFGLVDEMTWLSKKEQTSCYFISDGEYVKIGISNNVRYRMSMMQTGNAKKLLLLACFDFPFRDLAATTERLLHIKYKNKRISGEWYDILRDPFFVALINYAKEGAA